jgi:tRNA-Thr(GGU) m(6)t(6)A37 methyltransferase TsaA
MSCRPPGLRLAPIGQVRDGVIEVREPWTKGLRGIEGFSHIFVLFWLHQAGKPELLIHPRNEKRLPEVGFLATRAPRRANPIGLTVVKLLRRRGGRLWVEGLDAWDGTPVLDIKPYTPRDAISRCRIPAWVRMLDKLEADPLRRYGVPLRYRADARAAGQA